MSQSGEMGACPICGGIYAIDFLNAHVNDHLDNDQFKETEDAISREEGRDPRADPPVDGGNDVGGFGDIDEDAGFEVICPYPSCGRLIRMKYFRQHVLSEHSRESSHDYLCPICELLYQVNGQ